ncbi:MAG TPA: ABC transporter ATP-binding protein [Blastocatellia bacterium]|jgi:ABC-2 type transport system ATP-binding protein
MTDNDATPAISVRSLTKTYGRLVAVKNLSLEVRRGETVGFLGLNGAGKTTTIRILLDLLRPSSGRCFILGYDCQTEGLEARSHVGYLPGEMGLYGDLTGFELLDLMAGLGRRRVESHYRNELKRRLELEDRDLRRKLREYSTGMKRKLGIIQAFQHDPPLLMLDEPTEGLDPLMQESFYELLANLKRRGRTVFMSSHVLSEVERVCDRIALLRDGELVLLATVEEVRELAPRRVRVSFYEDVIPDEALPQAIEFIEKSPRAWTLEARGQLGSLIHALGRLPVADLIIEEPKLEDVLKSYYRKGD